MCQAVQIVRAQPKLFADRFVVEEETGAGGMGTIFRARDLHTGDTVALKVLHENQGQSAERFNQEAALLAELGHPAIVRYIDHGVTPQGEHYLAMEWLDGETLEDRLQRRPLGVLESVRMARRVLEALAIAHRRSIVHRDIKPANLFLPGEELTGVKLLDFGIARRMFDSRRITLTGSTLGTPMYMSPEQARGLQDIDARADIFSLGCVLFECLSGQPPFTGESPMAVLAKICLDDSLDVAKRCPDLPPGLGSILRRMLAKEPDRRPSSAAQVATELGSIIDALTANAVDADADANERADRRSRTPPPLLTTSEQRVLSVVMVSRPRAAATTPPSRADEDKSARRTWAELPAVTGPDQNAAGAGVLDDVAFANLTRQIEPFGARIDRLMDGSMIVTLLGRGTPTDQAVAAARCALRLRTLLPRSTLAISTGRAVLQGELPIGAVLDQAARLLGGEPPGAVCLDPLSARLCDARFQLDGADRPHLLFEKGLREAPRTLLGKDMPCVGRDRELGTLEALFDECVNEPVARAVLVTSPAGGGKSRVRHELLERLHGRGDPFELVIGGGDQVRAGTPFGVLGPALRTAAGITGAEPEVVQQKRLYTHVSRNVAIEKVRQVTAFLGEMCGLHFPDDDLPALRAARADPRLMADQVLSAWLDFLESECAERPVLLVLEDLHWGDVPSVKLVDAALRALRDRPFMVIAFARPEIDEAFAGLWAGRDLQRVSLPPLTSKASQKLARHALGDIGDERAAWLVERSDGNPFVLEELLRAVASGAEIGPETVVPETVLGMVQARFDALGDEAKHVLRAASVFGQTFRRAAVAALVGEETGKTLPDWFGILTEREVIFPRASGDAHEYAFRHGLVRDAAYGMLTADDRTRGHNLAGLHLEKVGERDAIVLVNHFELGADRPKAAHHCRFAAVQALEANDLTAVIERVARGMRLGALGEGLGHLRLVEAKARFWRGEYVECEAAAAAARGLTTAILRLQATSEWLAALGQQARYAEVESGLREVMLEAPSVVGGGDWFACLVRVAGYLASGGRFELVDQALARIDAAAAALEPAVLARAQDLRARVACFAGDHAVGVAGFEAAAAVFERLGDERSVAEMLTNRGVTLGELGALEQAEENLRRALGTAERLGLGYVSAGVRPNLVQILAFLGRAAEAQAVAERAVADTRAQGDRRFEGGALLYQAMALLLAGQAAAAEACAHAAVAALADVPTVRPAAVATLSRALLAQGRTAEALALAREANSLLDSLGQVEDGEVAIRLALAEALAATGELGDAKAALIKARDRLAIRAAAIARPDWRESFLARIPDHARTTELARAWGLA